MGDTYESPQPADGGRAGPDPCLAWHLACDIDATAIDRLDGALTQVFYERLLASRTRHQRAADKVALLCIELLKWCAMVGLVLALVWPPLDEPLLRTLQLDGALTLFFALLIPVSFALKRFGLWMGARARPAWPAYWRYLARSRSKAMLKHARAAVPFAAVYDFRGETASYFRIREQGAKHVWTRRLHGVRLGGDGFTLLYKNARAMSPHAIILHQPSCELDALFEDLGIVRILPGELSLSQAN